MTPEGWNAVPGNLKGETPAVAPPRDRPFIARNTRAEHDMLVWWSPEDSAWMRFDPYWRGCPIWNMFPRHIWTHFHYWREIEQ